MDPVESELGVDIGSEVLGGEAIAFESARCHKDKDSEGRIAEPESFGFGFGQSSDEQVEVIDFVGAIGMGSVDIAQTASDGLVLRGIELVEGTDGFHPQFGSEAVVSGDLTFPISQNIDGRKIEEFAGNGFSKAAQEIRVVVEAQSTG